MFKRNIKISPIKTNALRSPGDSLRTEKTRLLEDKLLPGFFCAMFLWAMAFQFWWSSMQQTPTNPAFYFLMAVLFTIYFVLRFWSIMPTIRRINLGIQGETAVGQYLERFREKGFRVFHDIDTERGNIDHLVICQQGAFTIETKTRKKLAKGRSVIKYNGQTISENGFQTDEPLIQAKAQAQYSVKLLRNLTGRDFVVKPVVVYPGWFIESSCGYDPEVWVLEPKALHQWIEKKPLTISPQDVRLAANQLSAHVRSQKIDE